MVETQTPEEALLERGTHEEKETYRVLKELQRTHDIAFPIIELALLRYATDEETLDHHRMAALYFRQAISGVTDMVLKPYQNAVSGEDEKYVHSELRKQKPMPSDRV